jgi:hypothetical protein
MQRFRLIVKQRLYEPLQVIDLFKNKMNLMFFDSLINVVVFN